MTNGTISEKCETLYNKLNAFVTSVISRDVTPKISNLNTEVWGSDTQTGNSRIDTLNTNFNNLDGSITSMESDINNVKSDINNVNSDINTVESDVSNLQTSVNSLSDSITNLNTRVKSGRVEGISVKKQNVASHTVTHNLGRPNLPVVTFDIGNSSSYEWGSIQATVYNVTKNNFTVRIYNNTKADGNLRVNWVIVATD